MPASPNYRDGTVAFEQLGVEVPENWSLNATNILAQKYFRGTPGTPQREWSLRQVADRVVDTITAWGTKDGYFVDDEEAEIFRAELKHLIIHQMAAFNSPVWFNIGVAGVPQQGSACQPYHALVSTPDGPVPIGELVEDERRRDQGARRARCDQGPRGEGQWQQRRLADHDQGWPPARRDCRPPGVASQRCDATADSCRLASSDPETR